MFHLKTNTVNISPPNEAKSSRRNHKHAENRLLLHISQIICIYNIFVCYNQDDTLHSGIANSRTCPYNQVLHTHFRLLFSECQYK